MDYFNVTTDGNELPITRMLDPGERSRQPYQPGSFVSGSVPQIKPLQAGGELERFIKKDGTINLNEVARFVGTSKSISPADRFILNEAIAKMDPDASYDYNEFKRNVSHYIPRMNLRIESWNSDYGVNRIFKDVSNLEGMDGVKYTSEVGVIGEGSLPDAVYSDTGGELKNYMLNNNTAAGMHYKPVPDDGGEFGSHSHYRVVRREDEPEVSYFLEIQSDALSPRGKNEYDRIRALGGAGNRSIGNFAYPTNPGQFSLDDMTGQLLVRGYRPMDIVQRLTTDYQGISNMKHRLYTIISENENLFPPISSFGPLNYQTEQKAMDAINALDEENFKKVFENSIEPRSIRTHASYLSPREQLNGISLLEDSFNDIAKRMNQINQKLSPESEFRNNLANSTDANNVSYDEGIAIYDEAMKGLIAENRYVSTLTFNAFEKVDEAYQYVDYKFQDLNDLKDTVEGFIDNYYKSIDYNKFLEDVQISREDMEPLSVILNEVKDINRQIQASFQNFASLRSDLGQIRRNLDIIDEAVFPVENPSYKPTPGFINTFNTIPETIERIKRVSGTAEIETIYKDFDETMKGYPDIYGLSERYNELMVEFEKEIKKFKDKYLPVTESNVTNPVSNIMKKRPERRIIGEALHGPHNNLYNRFPTEETSRKIQGHPAIGEDRSVNYEAVHRKYKNMEKTLKAMGYEPKLVTDKNGNTWWEVKASAGMIHGTAEYDAYFKGGRIGLKKKRNRKMRSVKC
jgi:regulator of replication initiation timing